MFGNDKDDPMGYQGRADPFSNFNVIRNELVALRETATELAVRNNDQLTGPYEINVDTTELVRAQEEANDIARESADRQYQLSREFAEEAAERAEEAAEREERAIVQRKELLAELESVGMDIGFIRLEARRSVEYLSCVCDALEEANGLLSAIDGTLREEFSQAERSANSRHHELIALLDESHSELVRVLATPRGTEAEELYQHALMQHRAKEFALCRRDLEALLLLNSTHVAGWILFGRLCLHYGQPAFAKTSFARAATYALEFKNKKAYVVAMIRLSHLERSVGNFERAYEVMVEVAGSVDKDSPLWPRVAYERIKADWAVRDHRTPEHAFDLALDLVSLFEDDPELRDEVASLPLFAQLRVYCPWLKIGKKRFATLAEQIEILLRLWPEHAERVTFEYEYNPYYRENVQNAFLVVLARIHDLLNAAGYNWIGGRTFDLLIHSERAVATIFKAVIKFDRKKQEFDMQFLGAVFDQGVDGDVEWLEILVKAHDLFMIKGEVVALDDSDYIDIHCRLRQIANYTNYFAKHPERLELDAKLGSVRLKEIEWSPLFAEYRVYLRLRSERNAELHRLYVEASVQRMRREWAVREAEKERRLAEARVLKAEEAAAAAVLTAERRKRECLAREMAAQQRARKREEATAEKERRRPMLEAKQKRDAEHRKRLVAMVLFMPIVFFMLFVLLCAVYIKFFFS